jgi:hypothetical protein
MWIFDAMVAILELLPGTFDIHKRKSPGQIFLINIRKRQRHG